MASKLTEKDIEVLEDKNKAHARFKLLELLKVCPHVIPASIGIEAYLNLLDEGVELMLKRDEYKKYKID